MVWTVGWPSGRSIPLREVADRFGVSPQCIAKSERSALRKLREGIPELEDPDLRLIAVRYIIEVLAREHRPEGGRRERL